MSILHGRAAAVRAALAALTLTGFGALGGAPLLAAGPPDPPTGVIARASDAKALVRWTAPVNTGQALVTRYEVTASPGGASCASTGSPAVARCTVSGLANDTAYTFTVTATAAGGTSAPSTQSATVTPRAGTPGVNFIAAGVSRVRWHQDQVAAVDPPTGRVWPQYVWAWSDFSGAIGSVFTSQDVHADTATVANADCTSSWKWVQILCDPSPPPGSPISSRDAPGHVYKANWNAGFTVDSVSATRAHVVVDLGQVRDFTTLRVFQMFSDGKVTRAAIAVSSETGDAWPVWDDGSWTPLTEGPVGSGTTLTTGGRNYTTCPTSFDFSATRGRYVRLTFMNSGEFGDPTWVEVGGAKLFFEDTAAAAGDSCPPGPPTDASATAGNATATVSWVPSTGGGDPDGFALQQSTDGGSSWTAATTSPSPVPAPATSALVTGLSNSQAYVFRVQATSAANGASPYSPPTAPVTPSGALPNPPTSVTVSPDEGSATVSWDPSPGATTYTVTGSPAGTCTTTGTSCTVDGLTPGLPYTFVVMAGNDSGTSGPSAATASVTPAAIAATPPDPPAGVTATAGTGSATVSWTPVAGATSYTVTGTPGGTCTTSETLCTITGLTPGRSYTFTVAASGAAGTSADSGPSNAVTPSGAAEAPREPQVPNEVAPPPPAPPGPAAPVVSKTRGTTRAVLPGGRTRRVFTLRYNQTGRYSFFLQTPAGRRVPLLPGTRVGTRLLSTVFWAPVVQDGRAGSQIPFRAVVRGTPPAGTVLRVILRHPDGSLEGVDLTI